MRSVSINNLFSGFVLCVVTAGESFLRTRNRILSTIHVRDFPDEMFGGDSDILYCDACNKAMSTVQHFQVTHHIRPPQFIKKKKLNMKKLNNSSPRAPQHPKNQLSVVFYVQH